MTGQNDWQDESLTGQVHDQAGHCPLTGRYFEPCLLVLCTFYASLCKLATSPVGSTGFKPGPIFADQKVIVFIYLIYM